MTILWSTAKTLRSGSSYSQFSNPEFELTQTQTSKQKKQSKTYIETDKNRWKPRKTNKSLWKPRETCRKPVKKPGRVRIPQSWSATRSVAFANTYA